MRKTGKHDRQTNQKVVEVAETIGAEMKKVKYLAGAGHSDNPTGTFPGGSKAYL